MNTTVRKTDQSLLASVPSGQFNNSASSLILFGKNFANYGSAMNENLVHIMENFAYNSPPVNPLNGQLWYDTTLKELKIFDSATGWQLVNANSLQGIAQAIVANRLHVSKNGDDSNSGQSWFAAKKTIASACAAAAQLIGNGTFTDQHVVILVAAGDYNEICPITVPEGVSIVGDNLRSVTVRPQGAGINVFQLNSKCYVYGITVRGHSLYPSALDITPTGYANASGKNLPRSTEQKGWAFSFEPGAQILVSPYIQNCSSISGDPGDPTKPQTGSGNFPGGGGVCVDSNIISPLSRINSIVVDAFTQINLGGIGVKVVNKGYMQLVSFFVNFCQFGILCVDGGHVTALNSNCSFGNYALWAEGNRSLESNSTTSGTQTQTFLGPQPSQGFQLNTFVADPRNVQVTLNNVIQTLNLDYVITTPSGSTFSLVVFTTPPPAGASIVVTFLARNTTNTVNQTWTVNLNQTSTGQPNSYQLVTSSNTLINPTQYRDVLVTRNGQALSYGTDYSISIAASGTESVITFPTNFLANGDFVTASVVFGSLIEASGYTMSYAGAGLHYGNPRFENDLSPSQGGQGLGDPNKYTITLSGGRVFHTTTDELGNFYIGTVTPGAVNSTTGTQANAIPTFRINQRQGIIDGRAFYQSIFGFMTPFVLALTRK